MWAGSPTSSRPHRGQRSRDWEATSQSSQTPRSAAPCSEDGAPNVHTDTVTGIEEPCHQLTEKRRTGAHSPRASNRGKMLMLAALQPPSQKPLQDKDRTSAWWRDSSLLRAGSAGRSGQQVSEGVWGPRGDMRRPGTSAPACPGPPPRYPGRGWPMRSQGSAGALL